MNDSLIKDIGRSYIISSLLPAGFFSLLAVFIFRGFLPQINNITMQTETVVLSSGLLFFALSIWLAFLLYSSVDFTFKLFEGYYYPPFIKIPLQYIQYRLQRWRLRDYYKYVENRKQSFDDTHPIKIVELDKLAQLENEAKRQLLAHEISAPIDCSWKSFLPTTLGNILLASELYPYEKYNLNGTMFFPRMSVIFPPEFASALEEKNNQVVFILNSSLLAYVIGILGILAGGIGLINGTNWSQPWMGFLQSLQTFLEPGYAHINRVTYLAIGIIFWGLGYVIYLMSINAVKEYAQFIRTSFDLYRFKALREMNHPVPLSLAEEKLVWEAITEYHILGDRFGEINFDYQLKKELEPQFPDKRKRSWLLSLFRY